VLLVVAATFQPARSTSLVNAELVMADLWYLNSFLVIEQPIITVSGHYDVLGCTIRLQRDN
jgi:hypothetical protein